MMACTFCDIAVTARFCHIRSVEHARIIDDLALLLGGQAALGKRLGVRNYDVCRWKERGIPARHWPKLLQIAKRRRYPLTLAKLEKDSPLRVRRVVRQPEAPAPAAPPTEQL